MESFVVGA